MDVLLAKGANINMSDGTYNYLTPLHSGTLFTILNRYSSASRDGKLEAVKFLVEKGADVSGLDGVGYTPLMLAAENGLLSISR